MSMTKEQEEAIEILENEKNNLYMLYTTGWQSCTKEQAKAKRKAIETILNMLKEKDKKIEKKNKIINLMTEAMNKIQDSQVCEYCINKEFYCDDGSKCKENIKQYFENKVDSNEQY